MHDAKGRELKVGDMVLIPATITELQAGEDFCNVSVESFYGRRPDGQKERISAINTGVMLLASAESLGITDEAPETEPALTD